MADVGASVDASVDREALLALATRLAEEAGALLLHGQAGERTAVRTKTSATDMVSEMDQAAERLVVEGLRAARPGDAILAEEGTDDAGTTGVRWVVDPLDGTTNYLYGLRAYAVSVAAEIDGVAEVGVVVDPSSAETFTAVRGRGAWCNGTALRCNTSKADLSTALVGTGFAYDAGRRATQARALVTVLPEVRDVRRIGAAALDLCFVACGRLDATYERGLQPWDAAAGLLIATEAGARSIQYPAVEGVPVGPLLVVSAPSIFDPLVELLERAGAPEA